MIELTEDEDGNPQELTLRFQWSVADQRALHSILGKLNFAGVFLAFNVVSKIIA